MKKIYWAGLFVFLIILLGAPLVLIFIPKFTGINIWKMISHDSNNTFLAPNKSTPSKKLTDLCIHSLEMDKNVEIHRCNPELFADLDPISKNIAQSLENNWQSSKTLFGKLIEIDIFWPSGDYEKQKDYEENDKKAIDQFKNLEKKEDGIFYIFEQIIKTKDLCCILSKNSLPLGDTYDKYKMMIIKGLQFLKVGFEYYNEYFDNLFKNINVIEKDEFKQCLWSIKLKDTYNLTTIVPILYNYEYIYNKFTFNLYKKASSKNDLEKSIINMELEKYLKPCLDLEEKFSTTEIKQLYNDRIISYNDMLSRLRNLRISVEILLALEKQTPDSLPQ